MEPKVIFEDREVLVLDKPAGMIVNRSDTTVGEKTVQNWIEQYLKILNPKSQIPNKSKIPNSNDQNGFEFRNSDFEFVNRAGIVHRLDKETSGILLVAKTKEAFENLQKQFKERQVKKTYIALVHGKIESVEGEINVPVGRLPWNRKRFGVMAEGRSAVTKYKVLCHAELVSASLQSRNSIPKSIRRAQNPEFTEGQVRDDRKEQLTLLELYPKSGRTHQIRVHLQYIKHPIFADPLYAGRKTSRQDRKLLSRVFLHAAKISFMHPKTNKPLSFESPLPEDLQIFLSSLSS